MMLDFAFKGRLSFTLHGNRRSVPVNGKYTPSPSSLSPNVHRAEAQIGFEGAIISISFLFNHNPELSRKERIDGIHQLMVDEILRHVRQGPSPWRYIEQLVIFLEVDD